MWIDIASIVFVCVTMNHLGLVKAIEKVADRELRIVNCPKCLTYWSVLAYTLITSRSAISSFAISFLASYTAIWLELFEGFIDKLYLKCYGKIVTDNDNDTPTTDADKGNSASTVPEL